ncbi:zinc finger protein 729-like isoform X2 [Coccinella septempunctata]|uniref:zinc finger protein 729-like isoform X2 n=1 Tax=Coccinella septempunctata TaxID=41139 RepID=UPI001D08AB82|nr:zinc finger protein 729-like isoform X2 [Coccinella septempunctata]
MDECFNFTWENSTNVVKDEVIIDSSETTGLSEEYEILDFIPQDCEADKVITEEQVSIHDNVAVDMMENTLTDEVVIEQWDGSVAEEVVGSEQDNIGDVDIPLPTNQDEYIASRPYPCDFCSRRFRKKVNLINHMAAHQRSHRYYECFVCGIRFINNSDLLDHQKNHDDPMEPGTLRKKVDHKKSFVCQLCGVGFSREKALTSHVRIHEGDSPLACKKCNRTFWDMSSMEEHWKMIHSNIYDIHGTSSKQDGRYGNYSCSICGISFYRQDDLKRHHQSHAEEENNDSQSDEVHSDGFEYRCMMCGESFIDEDLRSEHVREHHPEIEVLHCKTKEKFKRNVRSRRNRYHGHDEEYSNGNVKSSDQQFSCSECGKKFTTRSSQQIHMRIHTGERPYGCSFCHKAFTDGGTLRKHERIHTGEKPYACVICPKAFNQRVVLREHIRSHHSGPDPKYSNTYCCSVCPNMFGTSQELIVHLIEHCDTNTAMKRPPRIGPRKYTRRRKLKPYEEDALCFDVQEEESEEEVQLPQSGIPPKYEIDMDVRWTKKMKNESPQQAFMQYEEYSDKETVSPPTSVQESPCTFSETNPTYSETHYMMEPREESKNYTSANKSRAKMIHTEKKRKNIEPPVIKQKQRKTHYYMKSSYIESSARGDGSIKSRTKNVSHLITVPDKPPIAKFDEDVNAADNLLKLCEPFEKENNELFNSYKMETPEVAVEQTIEYNNTDVFKEEIVTRRSSRKTKGLSSRNRFIDGDNEEESTSRKKKRGKHARDRSLDESITKQEFEQCEEQVVYETPEYYAISEGNTNVEETQETILEPVTNNMEQNIDPLLEFAEISMQHAKSLFQCEMCSAVFLERSQLLAHVRIHI